VLPWRIFLFNHRYFLFINPFFIVVYVDDIISGLKVLYGQGACIVLGGDLFLEDCFPADIADGETQIRTDKSGGELDIKLLIVMVWVWVDVDLLNS